MRHVLLSKCGWFHHTAIGNPVIQLLKLFTKFYNLGNLFHKVNLNPCSKYYHHFQMVECINEQQHHFHLESDEFEQIQFHRSIHIEGQLSLFIDKELSSPSLSC